MTRDQLAQVSNQSQSLKTFIKAPMMLQAFTSALLSGITIVMLKLLTTLVFQGHDVWENIWLVILLLVIILLNSPIQMHVLNLAIKYYDQIEVMPVYQTAVMVLWICTGLIIFDEARFYSTLDLLGIVGSILLCCIGCGFLMVKTSSKKAEEKEDLEA